MPLRATPSRPTLSREEPELKVVILAGGLGTRISEETVAKPKPLVEIGGKPILWHIMRIYSTRGINEFVICCGYKGHLIKEYFSNYFLHMANVTLDRAANQMEVRGNFAEPWKVTLIDTGDASNAGGRLRRVASLVENNEAFCFTYGDGISFSLRTRPYGIGGTNACGGKRTALDRPAPAIDKGQVVGNQRRTRSGVTASGPSKPAIPHITGLSGRDVGLSLGG